MASSTQIKALMQSHIDKDDDRFLSIALQVAAHEARNGHGKLGKMRISPSPYHLNTIEGTGKVYVSSRKQALIWVIDQKNLKVVATINLPAGEGHQMAVVSK